MQVTLRQAKNQARILRQQGDFARALRLYQRIVQDLPLDYESRFAIADVLAETGAGEAAAQVYRTVAIHDIRAGHPLPAIVACFELARLGQPVDDIRRLLVETYAAGSSALARFAVKPAPVDPDTQLDLSDGDPAPLPQASDLARKAAVDLSIFLGYQEQYYPLPFLSELTRESFLAVLSSITVRRLSDQDLVVKQGEQGDSLFLVASGELRVFVESPDGGRELARLYENTVFGEMALITGQPRTASVGVVGAADVIGISRAALLPVMSALPAVRDGLDRFSRERLIKNLLRTSPLFLPFTKSQQGDLLRRFEGHEIEAGVDIVVEGQRGQGLFLILSGQVEVIAHAQSGAPVLLARLGPGELFGEMSLVTDQPTSATVRAVAPTSVLFLAREYVDRLVAAIPEVEAYFEKVALDRARDNSLRAAQPVQEFELDMSDVIPV
jgi:cAMP-dependent protein kinase regulator